VYKSADQEWSALPAFGEGFFRKPVELACLDIGIDLAVPCVVEIDLTESREKLVLVFFAQFANGGGDFGHAHWEIFGGKQEVSMRCGKCSCTDCSRKGR